MDAFEATARRLSEFGGALAAAVVIIITAHTILEVILRAAFDTSSYILEEFAGYGLAVIAFLCLGRTLIEGAMIRVNLLRDRLPARAVFALEIVSILVTTALVLFIGYHFAATALKYYQRGTVSETIARFPAWILPAVIAAGCALFAIQLTAYLSSVSRTGRFIADSVEDSPV